MPSYDHPQYTILREKHITGALSCATGVPTAFVGSTMRSSQKAVILGASYRIQSGGSAAGSNTIAICRTLAGGGVTVWRAQTITVSIGASAAGDVYDISLVSALTIASMGECAILQGQAASLDKVPVLSDIVWRYRILPSQSADPVIIG